MGILVAVTICSCATSEKKVELLVAPIVSTQPEMPVDVVQYVRSTLPDLRFVTVQDYRSDQYEYFRETIRWAVSGDFDGNGVVDIAALMVNTTQTVSLVAFHRSKGGVRHHILDDDLGEVPTGSTLRQQPAGRTWISFADAAETEQKTLKHPAIVEDLMETCHTMLYYWERGAYHSVYRGV